jgi:hypothetical protein
MILTCFLSFFLSLHNFSLVWKGKIALPMNIICQHFSMWESSSYSFNFTFLILVSLYDLHFFMWIQIVDPGGIANWSVTHVDWSERKWHPKLYRTQDVTSELLKNITVWSWLSSLCSFQTLLNMSVWSLLTSIKYLLFSFQKAHHIMLHSQYNRDLINVNIRLCKNFIFTCVNGSYIPCYYCVYKGGSGGEVVSSRDKPWPARTMQRVIINRSKGWLVFLVIFLVIILMDFRFELCYSYGFDCNTLSVLSFCSQSIWVFMWQVMKRYSFLKVFWVLYSFISCWLTSVLFFSSSPWAFIEGCAGATLPMEWYHTAVLLVCEEIPPWNYR